LAGFEKQPVEGLGCRVKIDRQMMYMRNYLLQMNRLSFRNNPLKMKTSGNIHLMDEPVEFEK
jgi:hypothetical protein